MKKNTAHRPSQSDQEYVIMSDGRKVRNTAYVASAKNNGVKEETARNVIEDFSESNRVKLNPGSSDSIYTGMDMMDNFMDAVVNDSTPSGEDVQEFTSFYDSLSEIQKRGGSDIDDFMYSYGINDVELRYEDDLQEWSNSKWSRIDIHSGDRNLPTSVYRIEDLSQPNVKQVVLEFDQGNDAGVNTISVAGNDSRTMFIAQKEGGFSTVYDYKKDSNGSFVLEHSEKAEDTQRRKEHERNIALENGIGGRMTSTTAKRAARYAYDHEGYYIRKNTEDETERNEKLEELRQRINDEQNMILHLSRGSNLSDTIKEFEENDPQGRTNPSMDELSDYVKQKGYLNDYYDFIPEGYEP